MKVTWKFQVVTIIINLNIQVSNMNILKSSLQAKLLLLYI